jgi:hypothetical protein
VTIATLPVSSLLSTTPYSSAVIDDAVNTGVRNSSVL